MSYAIKSCMKLFSFAVVLLATVVIAGQYAASFKNEVEADAKWWNQVFATYKKEFGKDMPISGPDGRPLAGRVLDDGDVAVMMVEAEATDNAWALINDGATAPTEQVVAEGLNRWQENPTWHGEIDAINLAIDLVKPHGDILFFGYPRAQQLSFEFEEFFHKCCRATAIDRGEFATRGRP